MTGLRVIFDGSTSYGALDSGISFGDGDSLSFLFRAPATAIEDYMPIVANSTGANGFYASYNNNLYTFRVGGITYATNASSSAIYDGQEHLVEVSRSGSTFTIDVDGVQVYSDSKTSVAMTLDRIMTDGTYYAEGELVEAIVIGENAYPITNETTLIDSGGSGNDLTLTNTASARISEWEWVGDFLEVNKNYFSETGLVPVRRTEGTRRRIVCGYSMDDAINRQAGEDYLSVTALNADQLSTLYGYETGRTVECQEEKFTPSEGTSIFTQTQRWVSQSD